jgi:hypothetical protein
MANIILGAYFLGILSPSLHQKISSSADARLGFFQ